MHIPIELRSPAIFPNHPRANAVLQAVAVGILFASCSAYNQNINIDKPAVIAGRTVGLAGGFALDTADSFGQGFKEAGSRINVRINSQMSSVAGPVSVASAADNCRRVIKVGDTLSRIASDTGTTVAALKNENGLPNENILEVGQSLDVCPGK